MGVINQSLRGTESSHDRVLLVSWLVLCSGDVTAACRLAPPVPPVAPLRLESRVEELWEGWMAACSTADEGQQNWAVIPCRLGLPAKKCRQG